MIRIVNIRYGEPYDIYIGRAMPRQGLAASKWQNPYKIGRTYSLWDSLANYCRDVQHNSELRAALGELDDKVLGCWCAPRHGVVGGDINQPMCCHGQVLGLLRKFNTPKDCGACFPLGDLLGAALWFHSSVEAVEKWMEKARNFPEFGKAMEIAVEAFSGEEDEVNDGKK